MASPVCSDLDVAGVRSWIGAPIMSISVFVSWVFFFFSPNVLLSVQIKMTTRNEMKSDSM